MSPQLDRYLVLKYPKLFVNRYSDMKSTAMCWGFDCDDGWFHLINNLCDSIQSYIDNNSKKWRIKNKIVRTIFKVIKPKYKSRFMIGSWNPFNLEFLRNFLFKLEDKLKKEEYETISQVTVDQVKEKFGGLSFYYSGGDDIIYGMVWLAEIMSYKICEKCGSTKNIGRTGGWIKVLCENCAKKPQQNLQWKKYEEDPNFLRRVKLDILNQK